MPTTLIGTTSCIGIGYIAANIFQHVESIERAITFPGWAGRTISYTGDGLHIESEGPRQISQYIDAGAKVFYVETSYGAVDGCDVGERIYMPMIESGHTRKEIPGATRLISPTESCAQQLLKHYRRESELLMIPIDTVAFPFDLRESVKTILHNGGSLGQNGRKGTDQAIRIFQESGVAGLGVRLLIRSWAPPPEELERIIRVNPAGITWETTFFERPWEAYKGCDLLLHTATVEGYGLTVPEAMACGMPVLCPAYAPPIEFQQDPGWHMPISGTSPIPHNDKAVYHHLDIGASAEILARICERSITKDSERCRAAIHKQLDWSRWRDKYEEAFA